MRDLPALPKDTLLCTIDVVGLYPNIPHSDGLDAIRKALDQRIDKNISTESLLDLEECVIKNNIFEHNNRFFKQKQGTAIGTKMSPPYTHKKYTRIKNITFKNLYTHKKYNI